MEQKSKKWGIRAFLLLCALLALAGGLSSCGSDGGAQLVATVMRAILSGAQETPAALTNASGTATVTISGDQTQVVVKVATQGLQNVTLAHIHIADLGQPGGIIFPLYSQADGPFPANLNKTLTSANFNAQPAAGINTFADAIQAILQGRTYVNVHTQLFPGGEIRGQIIPSEQQSIELRSVLGGGQERPNPVQTAASGTATVTVNAIAINLILNTQGLQNVIAAHIHVGSVGQPGDVIFPLYAQADGPFPAALNKTLMAANLVPSANAGIDNFNDAINALLSGNAYVNVHTQANPGGEIRGQIGPIRLQSNLNGQNEAPNPVNTLATGTAVVLLNAKQSEISLTLNTENIVNVTAAHIHLGAVGQPGGILFPLYSQADGPFPAALNKKLIAANLTPLGDVDTFEEAIDAILSGNTYINVHTQVNQGGEIRGQIGP